MNSTTLNVGTGVSINSGIITATNRLSTGNSGVGINITQNTISGPSELIIDPSAVGNNTGSVRILGDLLVDGSQTFINSTSIELADFNVGIATTVGTNALLDGAGIGIGSNGIRKTITWNNTASALTSSEDWNLVSGKQYEINGTGVLNSTTLGSGVVNSSLTSVGTLGSLNVSGITTLGVTTATNLTVQSINNSGITTTNSLSIGVNQVISSSRQLQNIASLDATTTATIESAISNAPNTFTNLQVTTGVSTLSDIRSVNITNTGVTTTTSLNIGLDVGISTTRTSIATTSATTVDSFPISIFRSARIQIQITQGTNYQASDILIIHDNITSDIIEYGSIATNDYLGTFSSTVSGGNCLLQVSMILPSSATVKVLSQKMTI